MTEKGLSERQINDYTYVISAEIELVMKKPLCEKCVIRWHATDRCVPAQICNKKYYSKLPHTINASSVPNQNLKRFLKRKIQAVHALVTRGTHSSLPRSTNLPCPSTRINNEIPIRSVLIAAEENIVAESLLWRSCLVQNACKHYTPISGPHTAATRQKWWKRLPVA